MTSNLFNETNSILKKLTAILLTVSGIVFTGTCLGVTGVSSDYDAVPPTILSGSSNTDPLVMLTMSNDHQLYIKAYTDYSDMDGNGVIDITYTDTFNYYGYFDSNRCYTNDGGKFVPASAATGTNNHHCASQWSGNFLNWATMTRMDVLRKVLFGGKRSTDNGTQTILERALIPTDVHAFVKTYAATATDMQKYTPYNKTQISMCNVTNGSGASQTATQPPLLRIADGLWPGWSTNEVAQCLFRNERNGGMSVEPNSTDKIDDLTVRVEVCVTGKEESNCKTYPGGNKRPTGLLQKFGERTNTPIHFGLMTGSYVKNKSGGVLRRDIGKISGNATASLNEIDTSSGSFINQGLTDKGIINTISRFRISKYDFGTRKYSDCNAPGIATITEGSSTTGCSNWGNPIGEIYMEALRYFSGNTTPTAAFVANDASNIPSLPQINSWTDPMTSANACANCSIVAISTGLNSFDTDQMGTASNIPGLSGGAADVNTKTNTVGNNLHENINGNSYIIGQTTATPNKQCTAKSISNFSEAKGICPELPTIEGGFLMAGLAHHAHITDMRTSLAGDQKVDTYAVSLAESLPSFTIPVGSNTLTFSPHCEANSNSTAAPSAAGWRACSLANVTIESLPAGLQTGSMLFHWEDSTWGNDYDMDGVERITWCVGTACSPAVATNQIKIVASTPLAAAGHKLLFGYTISGAGASDGVKRVVERDGSGCTGSCNFNLLYPPTGTKFPNTATYTVSGTSAALLKNPLWYAAKYGSFTDTNNNNRPDLTAEWDIKDNRTGTYNPDGIPDNFFQVTNPALLEAQLDKIFTAILARTSAGTALAILSTDTSDTAALYQALYDPLKQDGLKSVTWGGRLHALFVDNMGHIREDTNQNGKLDNYATDKIVDLFYSPTAKRTLLQLYTSADNGATRTVSGVPVEIDQLKPIWDARDKLSTLDPTSIVLQRTYSSAVSSASNRGRHILTWVDANTNGVINANEVVDFTSSTFGAANFGFLNVATEAEADNIVDYIRGKEGITNFRSRTIDYNNDGTDDVWRLGDIIHSTPAAVSKPASAYDVIYGDTTYATFANTYAERRRMLYVGANDGMIHAFNAGFYNAPTKEFKTTNTATTATTHPLGAEIWGYVPFNLLPHLKWLTEAGYPHVYYMDGEPRVFDVNIFSPGVDSTTGINHPKGWGTILVVGMRLGGGNLTYDHDNDGGATTPEITTRSAFVVLDITDPEVKPALLAEITHPSLGFTTSTPSLAVKRIPGAGNDWDSPATNTWHLIFGSGPTELDTVTSTQNASIFAYNLATNVFESSGAISLSGATNSFVGDTKTTDWNTNFIDDMVYFGTVGGTNAAPTGMLMRLPLDGAWTANTLLNPGQPFVSAPNTASDTQGRQWIYSGSGRLFTGTDNSSLTQQTFYGLKEPLTSGSPTYTGTLSVASNLQNVTTVQVFDDKSVLDPGSLLPAGTNTFDKLDAVIQGKEGWYRKFTANGTDPSTRSLSTSLLNQRFLLYTAYTPPVGNSCVAEGISSLFSVYFKTGTAYPALGLGSDPTVTNNGASQTIESIDIGKGIASKPTIIPGGTPPPPGPPTPPGPVPPGPPPPSCPPGTVAVTVQDSTGAIIRRCVTPPTLSGGRQSWRELTY